MQMEGSWHDWKKTIGKAINAAEFVGVSDDLMNKVSYRLEEFFAGSFDPDNREQRLLKELWEVGAEEEKRALTKMLTKLADRDVQR